MTQATITITITVEGAPDADVAAIRIDASETRPASSANDAEAIRVVVKRMKGRISRLWLRDLAATGLVGKPVVVSDELAKKYGLDRGLDLGGAIGGVATALYNATGKRRMPADRTEKSPSTWRMSAEDARIVLDALNESDD